MAKHNNAPQKPAPAKKRGDFVGLADQVRTRVLGQDEFVGAVVKDPVQDRVIWHEYLETVMKERSDWKDLYRACRDVE